MKLLLAVSRGMFVSSRPSYHKLKNRETSACCESWDVRVVLPIVSQSKEHKRIA